MLIDWTPQLVIFANVALAILLGGLIGIEREIADKPAGFRTHMLVAGAAALLVGLANPLLDMVQARESTEFLRPDPIRIVEALRESVSSAPERLSGAGASTSKVLPPPLPFSSAARSASPWP
ncbi:MAG TPA: MgtC/SapB family protein [Burkholderiales bacterium]|nr:MgtC/SapB family protein [Burkholderiales bacterium]